MYFMDVKTGEAVDIGGVARIRVEHKYGQRVKLAIATALTPIKLIPNGHIPDHYTLGMTNEVKPIIPRILAAS